MVERTQCASLRYRRPLPFFAVDGRLIVVRGGGSVRGCTIVTALTLPRNTEVLPPSGPFREITRRGLAAAPRYGARR